MLQASEGAAMHIGADEPAAALQLLAAAADATLQQPRIAFELSAPALVRHHPPPIACWVNTSDK